MKIIPVQGVSIASNSTQLEGRLLQVLAVEIGKNDLLIYHAMKLTAAVREELGL